MDGGWLVVSNFWFFKFLDNKSIYTSDIWLYICSTSHCLDGIEKPKKTKDKADKKRKEKTRESEKRSYKKKGKDTKRQRKCKGKSANCCWQKSPRGPGALRFFFQHHYQSDTEVPHQRPDFEFKRATKYIALIIWRAFNSITLIREVWILWRLILEFVICMNIMIQNSFGIDTCMMYWMRHLGETCLSKKLQSWSSFKTWCLFHRDDSRNIIAVNRPELRLHPKKIV